MILHILRPRAITTAAAVATGILSVVFATPSHAQVRDEREVRILRAPGAITIMRGVPANRAVLGVTLAGESRADTAGVRLDDVAAEGPAAKAGLKPGDIITAINGVNLKVSREDAEDPALGGLGQRRLQREMAKARPGDEIGLQVRSGSATRTVTVQAASAEALARRTAGVEERVITRGPEGVVMERRAGGTRRGVIGVTVGPAGNLRDTLGLFVSQVAGDGPADRAGLIEGERIAAVNGVDVRVPREDVEDAPAAAARVDRFVREVQKAEPGQPVSLRVWGNGRFRDVTVTVGTASNIRGGGLRLEADEVEIDGEGLGRAFEDMGRQLQERLREVEIEVRARRPIPDRSGAVRIRTTRTAL